MKRYMIALVAVLTLTAALGLTPVQTVFADDCGAGAFLAGNAAPNVINGGPQDDVIRGGGGNDTLRGLGCNDKIYGGAGDDLINGGPGWDYCEGGPGNDTFANCEVIVP